jgi:hypothetical protein
MKKTNLLMAFVIITGLILVAIQPVNAQTEPGQIIWINSPISSDLRAALDAYLQSPPSSAIYYAVTYTEPRGDSHYVTMVGLNIQSPDDPWSFTGLETVSPTGEHIYTTQVIWMETLLVAPDGTITLPFAHSTSAAFKLSMPIDAPLKDGGGTYVRFPWQPSKAVQWTALGVHGGGDLEIGDNWRAVDFVSGSDYGAGAAGDGVYASSHGEIQAICKDGVSVAIRVVGDESFIYGNLEDNAGIALEHSFQAGQKLATMKHGTFMGGCGNAIQQDQHWSVHWGFRTLNSTYKAEGCLLSNPSGPDKWKWQCGTTTIKPLGFMYHYGNVSSVPGSDPGTDGVHIYPGEGNGGGPSFWAYFLTGVKDIFDALILKRMPNHNSKMTPFVNAIMNGVKIVFRIVGVLIRGNLNLVPAATVIVLAITIKLALWIVELAGYIVRIIKSLPFIP